jgi:hypothetical protein
MSDPEYRIESDIGHGSDSVVISVVLAVTDSSSGEDHLSGDYDPVIEQQDSGVGSEEISGGRNVTDLGTGIDSVGITSGDISNPITRKHPQIAKLYLAVKVPRIIWTGRVLNVIEDPVEGDLATYLRMEIPYYSGDNVGGFDRNNFGDDLTLWIGSGAGLKDRGSCRVRRFDNYTNSPTGSIYVASDGTCTWRAGDYLSLTDVHDFWPMIHKVDASGEVWKDEDISSSDRNLTPVPVMGPPACALLDDGASYVLFDGSNSYAINQSQPGSPWQWPFPESGIASYSWWFEGGTPSTSSASRVEVLYTTPGQYIVSLTVYSVDGRSYTGYRNVFIFDPLSAVEADRPFTEIEGVTMNGSRDSGWSADLTVHGDMMTLAKLPCGSQVVIFAEESFEGESRQSGNFFPGRSNIKLVGWITDSGVSESGEVGAEAGLRISGFVEYCASFGNYAVYATSVDSTAGGWSYWPFLTIEQLYYYLFRWHWTVYRFMDVRRLEVNAFLTGHNFPEGSLKEQLDSIVPDMQLFWTCDRQGALRICADPTFNLDIRATRSRVYLLHQDMQNVDVSLKTGGVTSVEVSGLYSLAEYWSPPWSGVYTSVRSYAYTARFPRAGRNFSGADLVLDNQVLRGPDSALQLAQLQYSWLSRRTDSARLTLCGNFSDLDVAPVIGAVVTYVPTWIPRGVSWSAKLFWITEVSDTYTADAGTIFTTLTVQPNVNVLGDPTVDSEAVVIDDEHPSPSPVPAPKIPIPPKPPIPGPSIPTPPNIPVRPVVPIVPRTPYSPIIPVIRKMVEDMIKDVVQDVVAEGTTGQKIWPALMGAYSYLHYPGEVSTALAPLPGTPLNVRLLDTVEKVVRAYNSVVKEVYDRPIWVRETWKGSQGVSGYREQLYEVTGSRYVPALSDDLGDEYLSRTFMEQQAVFTVPGSLVVGTYVAPTLIVSTGGIQLYEVVSYVRTPPTGSLIALSVKANDVQVCSAVINPANYLGWSSLASPVFLPEDTRLDLDITYVGYITPGSDLSVHLRCRQFGV